MSGEQLLLWSVTTLIKEGLGTGKGLVHWHSTQPLKWAVENLDAFTALAKADPAAAVKTAADSRYAKSGQAAARGTDIHTAAEALALGQTPEIEEHIAPYVDQYVRFLERHQPEFLMAEAPIYNVSQHYAGTCDGIMVLGGKTVIFDIKSTEKAPDARSRPPYPETSLQMAAYARAELVGILSEKRESNYGRYYVFSPDQHHEPMPPVEGAVCIVVSPFDCRVIPMRIDDEVWRMFLHVRECARWQIDVSKRVIGPEITSPAKAEEVAA